MYVSKTVSSQADHANPCRAITEESFATATGTSSTTTLALERLVLDVRIPATMVSHHWATSCVGQTVDSAAATVCLYNVRLCLTLHTLRPHAQLQAHPV